MSDYEREIAKWIMVGLGILGLGAVTVIAIEGSLDVNEAQVYGTAVVEVAKVVMGGF